MTTSEINGLIIIDSWEPATHDSNKYIKRYVLPKLEFFNNLVNNLKKFNFSWTVVSSTHNLNTSNIIQSYLPTHNTVNITTQTEFFELRKRNKNFKQINHWLVVGTTWQVCLHLNDLGLCSFSTMIQQYPKLNFYGAPWGFLKHNLEPTTDSDFETDFLSWTKFDNIFKLVGAVNSGLTSIDPMNTIRNKYIDATPH